MADRYRITFEVTVDDEEKLHTYAQKSYQEKWGEELVVGTEGGQSLTERSLLQAIFFSGKRDPEEEGINYPSFMQVSKVFRRGG
jgi:hypothetical protein